MNKEVKQKFDSYPSSVRERLLKIRAAVYEVAEEDGLDEVTETLKWGEPAYLARQGSTLRIDWKSKNSDHVSVYFNCNTTLVETFKELYGDIFCIVGNREIQLPISAGIPMTQLKACISMSLRYHAIKHLPMLGA
ncbi:MAG: protein of unknown function (DU1801) [Candidatus Nitrotoga sp. LAW]|nr:MAG: protein of unknown function (DU1801) [Candidatus Nitrotoga sp. LAW]